MDRSFEIRATKGIWSVGFRDKREIDKNENMLQRDIRYIFEGFGKEMKYKLPFFTIIKMSFVIF